MKKILVASLMLCCVICQGQKDSDGGGIPLLPMDTLHLLSDTNDSVEVLHHGTFKAGDSAAYRFPILADSAYSIHDFWSKPDTLACIMLISDTSILEISTEATGTIYFHKPLYKSNNWMKGYYIPNNTLYLKYLDADKRPMSKNIIVWISKELN